MEPKHESPEGMPSVPIPSPELQPNREQQVERAPGYSVEQPAERAGEQHRAVTKTTAPIPVALPTPISVQSDDATQLGSDDDNPAVAADEDLIEKEWVDKAKKIIASTKDDPAAREKEVGKLQADYLRKRYGKELGQS